MLKTVNKLIKKRQNILLTGLAGSAKCFFLNGIYQENRNKILCLAATEEKAYDLARGLREFVDGDRVFLFPGRDFVFLKENYSNAEINRILTLQECLLHPKRKAFIIATPASLRYYLLSPLRMKENILCLAVGEEKPMTAILRQLVNSGFTRTATVTGPGEFAVRGGIIDIYPLSDKQPYRIEFFGDLIESIHRFNINSQRSGKSEAVIKIMPADELYEDNLDASLFDYLEKIVPVFLDEPREFYRNYERGIKRYREMIKELHHENKDVPELLLLSREELGQQIKSHPVIFHSFFAGNIPQVQVALIKHISQIEMENFYNNYEQFFSRVREWLKKEYTVKIAVKSTLAREQIKKDLSDRHLTGIQFSHSKVEKGFKSQTFKTVLISEKDIWGKKPVPTAGKQTRKTEEHLLVEDLKPGDYVVHENHGIGIFRGITRIDNNGAVQEYVLLQYAGTDRLYLPLDKLDLLYKYTSSGEKEPRLSKIGGTSWERTRKRVSESIKEMAEELLHLYAHRESGEGFAFSADAPWQREFEDDFPYEETPDQLRAINDVKRDMENSRPMDRLICGDVGYGKTEVAMRAAFKAIMDGKQVAILVPTTVLAEQHFQSFTERLEKYPTTVEVLSRFRSGSEQKKIINDIKKGAVDIVIGTHRLLSRDVEFKDLGLLVIDEEHRFGVKQKERIKIIKENVDVISLSATPIPRSMQMALSGLRDLSIIDTPPPERYPITTYVMEYNEEIIADAIIKETERNGQVFFVHNRIEDIYEVKKQLDRILPGVAVGIGHGKMPEDQLAGMVKRFLKGDFQVFLCTTIIESGLDMPNVNTIIVDRADKMGLAQLYQLRGRVGRSNKIAYAYLTYHRDRIITETAQKRLNAVREFNELGSGMRIALRDLEIRGAGNILGAEQHGYIQAVGFDMYCRLLEQETARLKGKTLQPNYNTQLDIDVDYYIPDSYIPDPGIKIRIYRRLLLAVEEEEIEEIKKELLDRFGKLPHPVKNFLRIALLRIKARDKDIKVLRKKGHHIEIQMTKSLPENLKTLANKAEIKRVNECTFSISGGDRSLETLENVLQMI